MSALRKQHHWRSKDQAFLDELARMLASGMSHAKCCHQVFGIASRNVTIGIVNRARAAGDVRFGIAASPAAVAAMRAARAPKAKPKPTPKTRRPALRLVDPALADLPMFSRRAAYLAWAPVTVEKSIVAVSSRECRYIAGDPKQGALCRAGATDVGVPYCDYHQRLVYVGGL